MLGTIEAKLREVEDAAAVETGVCATLKELSKAMVSTSINIRCLSIFNFQQKQGIPALLCEASPLFSIALCRECLVR